MPIQVLSDEVAAQIAAGEVVERPSSVVKELVENSIDAGATQVRVETLEGGKRLLRVDDDGHGIAAAEVDLAFYRHATSKLQTAADLDAVRTLGFRGEALASIAAVSRVTLTTRTADEAVGTLLRLEGGEVLARGPSGRPAGTALLVEDLFFNLPARRKFLHSDQTERRQVDAWITRFALAYPHLRLTVTHDGRETFHSPGSGQLRDVLVAVYGLEIGAAALEVDAREGPIQVVGLAAPPSLHRANRGFITLFVNGRWISDVQLTYAVIQAYHTLLPAGRYPLAVVSVDLPPDEVDVNVHPAKTEVRFRDANAVFRAVQRAVRRVLVAETPVPGVRPAASWPSRATGGDGDDGGEKGTEVDAESRRERLAALFAPPPARQMHFEARPEPPTVQAPAEASEKNASADWIPAGAATPQPSPATESRRLPMLRVVGQLQATYVIAEGPDGMYLIDQHAAHERVLFERLLAQQQGAGVASQALLETVPVDLSPEAAGLIAEHADRLTRLGFEIEPFGGSTVLVRALPALATRGSPQEILEDVAAALLVNDAPMGQHVEDTVARQVCKRAAVKAGQVLSRQEMEELVRSLEGSASPHTCPHGRPTMVHLSAVQLAREFGRS